MRNNSAFQGAICVDYTTEEVIKIVGISRRTLQNWLTAGKVYKPKEQGKPRRWTAEDIKVLIRVKHGEMQGAKGGAI